MIWPFRPRRPAALPRVGAPGEIVALVDDTVDPRLVVYHDPAGLQAEQYRSFRTNLRAMNPADDPRTLLFTSSQPREGKTVTVANLAMALAEGLQGHRSIAKLIYPGLREHPDHALAARQMSAYGGIVTLVVHGGFEGAKRLCERVRVFSLAESLGGVESLINHPATMTHASIPKEIREARGVVDGLVRLSVGIEDAEDLIEDLRQALA